MNLTINYDDAEIIFINEEKIKVNNFQQIMDKSFTKSSI